MIAVGLRVFAMARPRRSGSERDLVHALAKGTGSARCRALRAARAVVAAFLADQARTDPMERAIFATGQLLQRDPAHDPAHDLALDESSSVSEAFSRERLKRFEARGCVQLSATEWAGETSQVAEIVVARLARRFRDHLK